MTWNTHPAIQVQNLVSQISTDLQATGWTLYDNVAGAPVLSSVNNQGVTQYLQVSQGGTYQYLQFQGWLSWNASTHVGTSGSGTADQRLYFTGGAAIGATITVDLYTSVTANRLIVFVNGVGIFRNWAYFGGLDNLAASADPGCVVITAACSVFVGSGSNNAGYILAAAGATGGTFWPVFWGCIPASIAVTNVDNLSSTSSVLLSTTQVGADPSRIVLFPLLVIDSVSPGAIRGNLDGLYWLPNGNGGVSNLDTAVIGGVTYLVTVPGGNPAGNPHHPFTGNYGAALAIAEV